MSYEIFFKGPSIQLQQQRTSPSLLHDWHKDDLRCMEGDVDAADEQSRDGRSIFGSNSMKNCGILKLFRIETFRILTLLLGLK